MRDGLMRGGIGRKRLLRRIMIMRTSGGRGSEPSCKSLKDIFYIHHENDTTLGEDLGR